MEGEGDLPTARGLVVASFTSTTLAISGMKLRSVANVSVQIAANKQKQEGSRLGCQGILDIQQIL